MTAQDKINEATGRAKNKEKGIKDALIQVTPQLAKRLPRSTPPGSAERYIAIATSTINSNSNLTDCSPRSLVLCVLRAAEYGLAVDGLLGHAYLVPYKIQGVRTAQLQLGYRGLVELMMRTGLYTSVEARVVYEGDKFEFSYGLEPKLIHVPQLNTKERGELFATYALARPKEGPPNFVVLSREDVYRHRGSSMAYMYAEKKGNKDSIWHTHEDIAWKKSAIRQLSKQVAMSSEHHESVRRAAILDEQIEAGERSAMIVDADEPLEENHGSN